MSVVKCNALLLAKLSLPPSPERKTFLFHRSCNSYNSYIVLFEIKN